MMKNNIKYILLLAIGFLWCCLVYLAQELVLSEVFNATITNNVIMLYDSLAMALGIIMFIIVFKKKLDVRKFYIFFLVLSFVLNAIFYVLNIGSISMVISIIICLIGSAGFGVAYHFALVVNNVKVNNRGLVFALGYGIGAILTYVVSLIPNNFVSSPKLLIITTPLILVNIYFIYKSERLNLYKKDETIPPLEKKKLILLISLVFVMSLISSFSSNMFAVLNYGNQTGFAGTRIYYALGLILAGYLADKNNKLFDVITIASLLYPLLAIILLKEQISFSLLYGLNYFFISFFVIYRTLSFMNISNKHKIYYSALGLCVCRVVEGLLTLVNNYVGFSYLFLVISIVILFSIMIGIYIYLHNLSFVNKEDVFQNFCVKYKLSTQESKTLNLILQDYSNQEIADYLVVSINTVRNHVAHIYKKCDMKKGQIKELIIKKTI